ncbi:MAG: dimethylarginine dimethylaminohydrolase [Gammaproteobacteria bacterium]|nr:dimethylarginine dimethylaminohydrolase [Gammaproteobacteria bacterium]MYF28292.1 dimethylarginine dimethylaminohydrolase [Gammaproteobacteria bacterium]MYK47284.1 dimethylarginine dimethylaminohydrolase [Gammaproteobacteria bacterium]
MEPGSSYRFSDALCRKPGRSVVRGLRASFAAVDPEPNAFAREHDAYVATLRRAGLNVTVLDPLEAFPDSVFVEDVALCVAGIAIILRPGAASRFGERDAAKDALSRAFATVVDLDTDGFVDGGDILVTEREVLVGASTRTDAIGADALASILSDVGIQLRKVATPGEILHFKSACGLLDAETVFCTRALAATGCFTGYQIIECPEGEESAANLVRINDVVLVSAGHSSTLALLGAEGYDVATVPAFEAAKLDGGLSCMSLRWLAA